MEKSDLGLKIRSNGMQLFLLLNEIRAAAKRESLRLENVSNRPRYFISGFKDLKQLKTQLSIFFTSAPDRVIDQCAFDEESTFKEPLKNCRFAQQSFKKSGRKFQYLAIFSSKQPVFLEN